MPVTRADVVDENAGLSATDGRDRIQDSADRGVGDRVGLSAVRTELELCPHLGRLAADNERVGDGAGESVEWQVITSIDEFGCQVPAFLVGEEVVVVEESAMDEVQCRGRAFSDLGGPYGRIPRLRAILATRSPPGPGRHSPRRVRARHCR